MVLTVALPADVWQVTLVGTSPGGEEWATGFWMNGGSPQSSSDANTQAALIAGLAAFTTFTTALRGLMATDCAITQLRIYSYPAGGSKAAFVGVKTLAGLNGTGSGGNALQVAGVATLHTEFAGRRARGRMYLPVSATGAMQAHQLSGFVNTIDTALANLFSSINTAYDASAVSVVSRVGAMATSVTSVSCDSRPDVQRRRAASYAATSSHATAVTG